MSNWRELLCGELQDLAVKMFKIPNLVCRILKFQDLAVKMFKIPNLVCRILKFQYLAVQDLIIFQDIDDIKSCRQDLEISEISISRSCRQDPVLQDIEISISALQDKFQYLAIS